MSNKTARVRRIIRRDGDQCCWCSVSVMPIPNYHAAKYQGADVSGFKEGTVEYHFANLVYSSDIEDRRVACLDCVRETSGVPWLYNGDEGAKRSKLLLKLFARDGDCCWLCSCEVKPAWELRAMLAAGDESFKQFRMATVDHYLPIVLGGKDGLYNLRVACYGCNSKRGKAVEQGADYEDWRPDSAQLG